jgi:hypothetical protein
MISSSDRKRPHETDREGTLSRAIAQLNSLDPELASIPYYRELFDQLAPAGSLAPRVSLQPVQLGYQP